MKTALCFLLLVLLPGLGWCADKETADPRSTYLPAGYHEVQTDPQGNENIRKYAEDGQEGPQQNFGVQPIHDNQIFATFMGDRFEYQWREHDIEALLWDVEGWIGNDYHKLVLESEGDIRMDGPDKVEEAGIELLYGRNIAKFWDLQAGVRHDFRPRPQRSFAAFGFQGLAPQWFEVDATAYLSEDGDLSARLEVEYEWMLTQRLVVIPRLETHLSLQDVPKYEEWEGITDVTVGIRLAYQIRREFAPYVGVSWTRLVGETASRIEDEGGDTDSGAALAGIRFWF